MSRIQPKSLLKLRLQISYLSRLFLLFLLFAIFNLIITLQKCNGQKREGKRERELFNNIRKLNLRMSGLR